jgi:hypothetical protein
LASAFSVRLISKAFTPSDFLRAGAVPSRPAASLQGCVTHTDYPGVVSEFDKKLNNRSTTLASQFKTVPIGNHCFSVI